MLKSSIYILLLFCSIVAIYAKDDSDECDEDDLDCIQDYITSISSSYVTSASSFQEDYSTLSVVLTETLTDFHEAKVAHPKHGVQRPDRQPTLLPSQDNIGSIQDLDSGSDGLSDSIEETDSVGLGRVEAGVLSACGILVVAGIAVGIFVWKNTAKRQNQGNMSDLESHLDTDNHPTIVNGAVSLANTHQSKEKHKSVIQSDQSVSLDMTLTTLEQGNNKSFGIWKQQQVTKLEPTQVDLTLQPNEKEESTVDILQASDSTQFEDRIIQVDVIDLQTKTINDGTSSIYNTPILELDKENTSTAQQTNQLHRFAYEPTFVDSPGIEENVTARPSALDPTFDPTALTYPLKKLLHTPRISVSPAQISIDLGQTEGQGDKEEEEGEPIHIPPQIDQLQNDHPNHGKDQSNTPALKLGQQLNKLLRHPNQRKFPTEQEQNSAPMVDISLISPSTSPNHIHHKMNKSKRKNRMLEKFAKTPMKLRPLSKSIDMSAQSIKEDYTEKYETEHGKPFLSPLDLPNDKFIPLRDAAGPALMSRAEVLADPIKRLGQDEIALWEQKSKRKELKNLSYEMWDEQMMRQETEHT